MTSECFNHAARTGAIPGTSSLSTDVSMVCKLCGALLCAQHGQRDPNKPACIGVECDPNLLTASAAAVAPAGSATQQLVGDLLDRIPAAFLVRDLEEFLQRRPRYRYEDWLRRAVADDRERLAYRFGAENELWSGVPERGRDLLTAAGVLVRQLEVPSEVVHPAAREMFYGSWS